MNEHMKMEQANNKYPVFALVFPWNFFSFNCTFTGTSIVTVKAFAPDTIQDSIKYSIFSGNEDGVFSLCSNSGKSSLPSSNFNVTSNKYFSKGNNAWKVESVTGK